MVIDNISKNSTKINKNLKSSGNIKIDFENLKIFNFDYKLENEIKLRKNNREARITNKNNQISCNLQFKD